MAARTLEDINWFIDRDAVGRGDPGIVHSFVASLATTLNYLSDDFDPVWMMGASAFAFRILVNETFCPSAASMFDFNRLLPEAVEQAGYQCTHIGRFWDERHEEEERRLLAHRAIVEGVDRGCPAVVWDVSDAEWGLVTGYDTIRRKYGTLTCRGERASLPLRKLGRNGIDILSVIIPLERNGRTRDEVITRSLRAAVDHAEQKEWMDRPRYQDGLPAYDQWATLLDRWASLVESGAGKSVPSDMRFFAGYYAAHYYSARCYARDYMERLASMHPFLESASLEYREIAAHLKPLWLCFNAEDETSPEMLRLLAHNVRSARAAEQEAVAYIRRYLERSGAAE